MVCRKNKDGRDREREKEKEHKHPFKVVEITPPPRCLGVRCFPTVRLSLAVCLFIAVIFVFRCISAAAKLPCATRN